MRGKLIYRRFEHQEIKKKEIMVSKTDLINGSTFEFENDLSEGFIEFDKVFCKFYIFFDGELIHSSKGFKSAKNKLDQLFKDNDIENIN